jgi:predicted RecB family nuclease
MVPTGTLRTCPNGHRYYKSSDCPTCPICEKDKALAGFPKLSAPARRALEGAGIRTLEHLAKKSEAEIMALHGMGPSTLPKLRAALKAARLSFKKN